MRIGVLILPAAGWREAREDWRGADELGFAHAWTYDHIAWRDLIGKTWYSAIPTLTAAAAVTRRIRLGTLLATPNFRHPVPLAKEALTLDDISGGRFILGLGAGAGGADARVLGGRAWTAAERAGRFAEFVELSDLLLSAPVTSYQGRYYAAEEAHVDPAAGTRPRLPFAIGATGPRGMRLAARHAEYWVTNGTSPAPGLIAPAADPKLVAGQVARLREACEREGRDPGTLRTLLLNVNREEPPLRSVAAFEDAVGRFEEAGITDMVVPFPRTQPPFVGARATLERIAATLPADSAG
ncbi:LLM class flavin-dependent oxidoreductase [Actinospica durhamensis]|uniref:LLM class flavin-dependent oxidoreductase n=1 Tax=Actinospica durhamensis TaxID=1508375 RepID=A0A941EPK4_9ACTN|nr:LLM class flavin-dependent oxidoreductase [Actinospica durhamensis]MBR7835036.1 LLM class flavin-dependent oxidoreductase [Actinospica durhamensis]